jgi:hypothetical protein
MELLPRLRGRGLSLLRPSDSPSAALVASRKCKRPSKFLRSLLVAFCLSRRFFSSHPSLNPSPTLLLHNNTPSLSPPHSFITIFRHIFVASPPIALVCLLCSIYAHVRYAYKGAATSIITYSTISAPHVVLPHSGRRSLCHISASQNHREVIEIVGTCSSVPDRVVAGILLGGRSVPHESPVVPSSSASRYTRTRANLSFLSNAQQIEVEGKQLTNTLLGSSPVRGPRILRVASLTSPMRALSARIHSVTLACISYALSSSGGFRWFLARKHAASSV